jgi:hypothetical protein
MSHLIVASEHLLHRISEALVGEFLNPYTHRCIMNTAEGKEHSATNLVYETILWRLFYFSVTVKRKIVPVLN